MFYPHHTGSEKATDLTKLASPTTHEKTSTMRNNNTINYTNPMTPEKFESTDFLALADKVIFNHLKGVNHNGLQAYAYLDNDDTIPVQFTIRIGRNDVKEFTIRVDRKMFLQAHWGEIEFTPGLYCQLKPQVYKYWRFVETIKDHYSSKFHRPLTDDEAVAIYNSIEKGFKDGTLKA